jgi:hypothetical protein
VCYEASAAVSLAEIEPSLDAVEPTINVIEFAIDADKVIR